MLEGSQLRLLAPAALVVFAIAFAIVLLSSGGDRPPPSAQAPPPRSAPKVPPVSRIHVVRRGESLSAISERRGVPVARLRELNPTLDPQVLLPGQRVKLRP